MPQPAGAAISTQGAARPATSSGVQTRSDHHVGGERDGEPVVEQPRAVERADGTVAVSHAVQEGTLSPRGSDDGRGAIRHPTGDDVSAEYTFRVAGRLTPRLLGGARPTRSAATATDTLLVGRVADRAALHGFIARIEALGLELVELQRLPHRPAADGCCPECGRDADAGEQNRPTTRVRPRT